MSGPIRQRTVVEDGVAYNVWEQPDRKRVLDGNAYKQTINPRRRDWIKPLATIPLEDHEVLKRDRPDMLKDRRQLERYVNSSEGRKFRTTPRGRSRNFSFGGI